VAIMPTSMQTEGSRRISTGKSKVLEIVFSTWLDLSCNKTTFMIFLTTFNLDIYTKIFRDTRNTSWMLVRCHGLINLYIDILIKIFNYSQYFYFI
jgi:hypothetical protein